jgi:Effector protein
MAEHTRLQERPRGEDRHREERDGRQVDTPALPPHVTHALALQRSVGNRATAAVLQRFWVKAGGQYRWVSKNKRKRRYVKTSEKHWNRWHWGASSVYVPPEEAMVLTTEMVFNDDRSAEIYDAIRDDLHRINQSRIGKRLLVELANARHVTRVQPTDMPLSSGPITESPGDERNDPRDPARGSPPTISIPADDEVDVFDLPLEKVRKHPAEPAWNPTPRHVALFHELVHAWHHTTGTAASGRVSKKQARHKGDVDVALSEYQATGLNTADGAHTFEDDEPFTENAYRDELLLAHRDTYIPRGYRTERPPEGFKEKVEDEQPAMDTPGKHTLKTLSES